MAQTNKIGKLEKENKQVNYRRIPNVITENKATCHESRTYIKKKMKTKWVETGVKVYDKTKWKKNQH